MMDVTYQEFRATAARRGTEAAELLEHPRQKRKDGAVVCALLAAECALKALLLYVHSADSAAAAQPAIAPCFKGANGHRLQILYHELEASIKGGRTEEEHKAVSTLHELDRYAYRYGSAGTAIQVAAARRHVECAEMLIQWMQRVVK